MLALAALVLAQTLWVRSSSVDITPPEPLPLGGYTERGGKLFEPGGEELWSNALILSQGTMKLAVVSVEMLTIPESLYREVRARIPPDVRLFLSATHTHSAPDSQMLNERMTLSVPGIANFRPRWLEWYAAKIASSVNHALAKKGSSHTALSIRSAPLGLNRGRRAGALPDSVASIVSAGKPQDGTPLFMSYAAHAVIHGASNLKLSGDWPGWINDLGVGLVLVGAIGDVSPAVDGGSPEERLRKFVFETIRVWASSNPRPASFPADPLRWIETPIPLAPASAHPDFAKSNRIPEVIAQNLVSRFAPPTAKVSAFRLGKLAVVGIPGEPTSHLGRSIRDYGRGIGFRSVLVVSHVNGWMGYILNPEDYDRGGYEATLSFYGRKQGEAVVRTAKEALQGLVAPGRVGLSRKH